MRRAMSHRRTVNSLTRKNAQRGATERPPWNERLYLAQIIRLRLRRAEKYLLRLRPLPPAHASSKKIQALQIPTPQYRHEKPSDTYHRNSVSVPIFRPPRALSVTPLKVES